MVVLKKICLELKCLHAQLFGWRLCRDPRIRILRNVHKTRLGIWNAPSINIVGKLENNKRQIERNNIDILGLCEIKWEGEGELPRASSRCFTRDKHGGIEWALL